MNEITKFTITFEFSDGSKYWLRESGVGDTIMGDLAHEIMFAMNKKYQYFFSPSVENRITFILNYKPQANGNNTHAS